LSTHICCVLYLHRRRKRKHPKQVTAITDDSTDQLNQGLIGNIQVQSTVPADDSTDQLNQVLIDNSNTQVQSTVPADDSTDQLNQVLIDNSDTQVQSTAVDSTDRLNQPPLQHVDDLSKKESLQHEIEILELTVCNKKQEVDSLEKEKQYLYTIIELLEKRKKYTEDPDKTSRGIKLDSDALKEEEITQLKEELAKVKTDLNNSKEEVNEYENKLDRTGKECEKYRCETEELRKKLTEVTEENRYLELNTSVTKKQNSTGSLGLGEHFVYYCKLYLTDNRDSIHIW